MFIWHQSIQEFKDDSTEWCQRKFHLQLKAWKLFELEKYQRALCPWHTERWRLFGHQTSLDSIAMTVTFYNSTSSTAILLGWPCQHYDGRKCLGLSSGDLACPVRCTSLDDAILTWLQYWVAAQIKTGGRGFDRRRRANMDDCTGNLILVGLTSALIWLILNFANGLVL